MTLSFSGIENVEFYSGHYLDAVLEGDLKAQFEAWSTAETDKGIRAPWKALESLGNAYFQSRKAASDESDAHARLRLARDFHAKLTEALGYRYAPDLIELDDDTHLPILAATTRDSRPFLWILDAPFPPPRTEDHDPLDESPRHPDRTDPLFQAQLPRGSFRDLFDETLFRLENGPRWILFLSGSEAILAERNKWLQGRLLRFSFDELFRRRDTEALKAVCGLLHRDVLAPDSGLCLHDTLDENSHKHAFAVSGDLKHGIRRALELLANEAVHYRRETKKAVFSNEDFANKLTQESLTWLYRLLFLFYVEARGEELHTVPMRSETYRKGYSLETLRDLELVPLHTEKAQNGYFLHDSLQTLFRIVQQGFPTSPTASDKKGTLGLDFADTVDAHGMRVTALNSPLFDDERLDALKGVRFRNKVLQEVLQLMSLSKEQRRGQRGRISYAQLGINQLGAVYESLLSYTGFFAQEDLYEVASASDNRDTAGKSREDLQSWFVPASRIGDYEDEEIVKDEQGKKLVHGKGTFLYRLSGRHREKSASYYTPEVLTRCLVKYSLKELLYESKEDGSQGAPKLSAAEILQLTVCEPAMGSGAFLLEAVDQLADAYLQRAQAERGEAIPSGEYQEHKRRVKARLATNNCHGVDLNPVAVELGKVSLWLGTMYQGGKCPWFGLRLAVGNSLVGARRQVFLSKDVARAGSKTDPNWLGLVPVAVPMFAESGPRLGEKGWSLPARPKGSIYHFLLPADGMAPSDGDKVVKQLVPAAVKAITDWRGAFCKPFDKADVARLEKLSDAVDRLWAQVCRERALACRESTDTVPVWGEAGFDAARAAGLEVKDQEEVAAALEESSSAYRRLKLVMDLWCALWFWPLDQAERLPTREMCLRVLELVLIGQVDARVVYAQGGLFTGRQAAQGTLALGAAPVAGVKVDATATGERLARLKALSAAFEARRREGTAECGLADVAAVVAAEPMLGVVERVAARLRFHHWELRFAEVFAGRGGFDLILGNPPWIKVSFDPRQAASELYPSIAIKDQSATVFGRLLPELAASNPTLVTLLQDEFAQTAGLQSTLANSPLYPELTRQPANLYKGFLARTLSIASPQGVTGLIHPQGVYDHKDASEWRTRLYSQLRYYFHFENQWPLFRDVLNTRKFLTCVYGPIKSKVRFLAICNLVHPSTIDASFAHDGRGALPAQKDENGWITAGHMKRVIHFDSELLALSEKSVDDETPENGNESTPTSGSRILNLYSQDHSNVLTAFSIAASRLGDLQGQHACSGMWDERSAQDHGIIVRSCSAPTTFDTWVVSGPHIYVGTLPYQQANPGCKNPRDYTLIDPEHWDFETQPRSPYSFVKSRAHARRQQQFQGRDFSQHWRIISRRMVDPSSERSLCATVLPPGPHHIDLCFGIALELESVASVAWPMLSLPYDFLLKATGKTQFRREIADSLPVLGDNRLSQIGISRLCILVCNRREFAPLWRTNSKAIKSTPAFFSTDRRLILPPRSNEWSSECYLRSDFARRQAMLEIDILAARLLGISLGALTSIYQANFGTLVGNERNNVYDQHGRLVPNSVTANGNPCVSLIKLASLLKEQAAFDIHREYFPGAPDTEDLLAKRVKLAKRDAAVLQVAEHCRVGDLMATTEARWSSPDYPEGRLVPLVGLRYTDPGLEPRKQRIYPTPWTRHSREADYAQAWERLHG